MNWLSLSPIITFVFSLFLLFSFTTEFLGYWREGSSLVRFHYYLLAGMVNGRGNAGECMSMCVHHKESACLFVSSAVSTSSSGSSTISSQLDHEPFGSNARDEKCTLRRIPPSPASLLPSCSHIPLSFSFLPQCSQVSFFFSYPRSCLSPTRSIFIPRLRCKGKRPQQSMPIQTNKLKKERARDFLCVKAR